jgi:3-hydroxy-3-methylglutaryl CoA synthase/uncharacterized OB-fold protein
VPRGRLARAAIGELLGSRAGAGSRSVASYDEDSTSLAVEAARGALRGAPEDWAPEALVFATTTPPYQDKTNATTVHAALGLDPGIGAYDFTGAARSAIGALRLAHASSLRTLVAIGEVRTGLPGSADEAEGGDAGAAFAFGPSGALAELVAQSSRSEEFLERWREPGELGSRVWEERFGEAVYRPLAEQAIAEAGAGEANHAIVTGLHTRAVRAVARSFPAPTDDLTAAIGNSGGAHAGVLLADVLDRAGPGETIVLVSLADGVDVLVYRTTEALAGYRRDSTVAAQANGGREIPYPTFLTWRGALRREPPRRPDPNAPAAPPALRNEHWKFGLTASRCEECGTRHMPPQRVCLSCRAVDRMQAERLAETRGRIANFTVDRLAFTPSPPLVSAVIDFDGGGRAQIQLTDTDPDEVDIGTRVEMTFRRLYTAPNGVHNYFWKARPIEEDS